MLGEQRPRVAYLAPSSGRSWGEEFSALAAECGVVLDPWQRYVLDAGLMEDDQGLFAAFMVVLLVARQNGKTAVVAALVLGFIALLEDELIIYSAHQFKALDVETPILTTAGWSTMGALVDGAEVFAPDGQPTKVLAAHPVRFGRPCFRVRLDDGQELVADAEHLWQVIDSHDMAVRVLTTAELIDGGVSTAAARSGRDRRTYRWRIELPGPIVGPDVGLPIDPWLLGAWLGDGDSNGGRLTVGAEDLDYITGRLDVLGESYRASPDRRHPTVFGVYIHGLRARLRDLGVLGRKSIPEAYMLASEGQRRQLLAGIMDTDGTVSAHQIAVTMVKRELMAEVASLVRSLGYKASLREFRASLDGTDAGPMYRVQFSASQDRPPFDMPRKASKVRPRQQRTTRSQYNAIVAIESVATRPTRCITVAHESGCYLAGSGLVPTHNTTKETFRLVDKMVKAGPLRSLWKKNRESGVETAIEFKSGARIIFVARSGSSGRGFTGNKVVLDEGFSVRQEMLGALIPTMTAMPNPQVWVASSAPMHDSDALHNLRRRALGDRPGRLTLLEWSAEAGVERDDRRAWAQANPALGYRVTERYIEDELDSLPAREFERERLGIGDDPDGSGVVELARWTALIDGDSEIARPLAFAFDITPERDAAAVAVAGVRLDGAAHVEITEALPGVEWLLGYLVERWKRWSVPVWVELSSPAAALIGPLEAHGVEVKTQPRGGGSAALLADAITAGAVRHLGQASLTSALVGARRKVMGDTWTWSRASSTTDISPLVAASLAHYGAMVEPPPPPRRRARVL